MEIFFSMFSNINVVSYDGVAKLVNKLIIHRARKSLSSSSYNEGSTQGSLKEADYNPDDSIGVTSNKFTIVKSVTIMIEEMLDFQYKQDIAFLVIKVLNLTQFDSRNKYMDMVWIMHNIDIATSKPFLTRRFWIYFEAISQDQFEDFIILTLKEIKSNPIFEEKKDVILENSKNNGYIRIYIYMIDEGASHQFEETLRLFVGYSNATNYTYLFYWLKSKLSN